MKIEANNYALGIGLILIPFFNFLSFNNLKQLSTPQITYTGLSLIPVVLGVFILSWVGSKVLTRSGQFRTSTLFTLICAGFYLQFHYLPLKGEIRRHFDFALIGDENIITNALVLLLLASIWLGIIVLGSKYPRFTKRALMIFTSLFLVISIGSSVRYFITKFIAESIVDKETVASNKIKKADMDLYMTSSRDAIQSRMTAKLFPNVYFVIVDGMMSLEHASELGIVDQQKELVKLNNVGLTYVEKSRSSYNTTYLTLASIFQLDYHQTPMSRPYLGRTEFFPLMMHSEASKGMSGEPSLPLFYALEKNKIRFIWEGTIWAKCFRSGKWRCGSVDLKGSNRFTSQFGEYKDFVTPFYRPSIGGAILDRLIFIWDVFGNTDYALWIQTQHSLVSFMNNFDAITAWGEGYFAFIHQMSPHHPHKVTETCDGISKPFANAFTGYRASYRCVLQEIERFVEKMNAIDPNSIIVIQADHGWNGERDNPLNPIEINDKEKASFQAEIFSAIKAPDTCFNRFGIPQSTVNSIRFALNCAYRFKFPYKDNVHYIKKYPASHPEFGTIVKYVESG